MILKNVLKNIEKYTKSKVIIIDDNKELYNNYLDKSKVYKFLEDANIKAIYASDNDIVIELESLEMNI